MKDLRASLDWPLPALLAAYNAGEKKAAEWVARFPDPDLFMERIGWHETRSYVRHVLDAFWKYRAAYGADASRVEEPDPPEGKGNGGTEQRGDR